MKLSIAVALTVIGLISIDACDCKIVQFIFGDSLSDVGNNNRLPNSLAKANLPWYGIDFETGMPNGRFTNGRTVADIMGDKMGLPRPPAFLDPSLTEDKILQNGVNYASGGGGILNQTGAYFIERFCLYKQIELFQGTQEKIRKKIGKKAADKFFQESRYVVALGSNDFINNYLMPVNSDSWKYNDDSFIAYLAETFQAQLRLLHNLGVRQLTAFGLGPMGCIPLQRVMSTSGGCQDRSNKLATGFNEAMSKMMDEMSGRLPNAAFKFGDAYDVISTILSNPKEYGFDNSTSPCCSFGRIRPALTCTPVSTLCSDRSKYVFWDEYHPTDKANEIIATELIKKFGLLQTEAPSPLPYPSFTPAPAFAPASEG